MRTLPGAEMTREDMREEKRDEGENALASKGRLGRYEESTASDYLAEYRMT
jgi:hypothetical protein